MLSLLYSFTVTKKTSEATKKNLRNTPSPKTYCNIRKNNREKCTLILCKTVFIVHRHRSLLLILFWRLAIKTKVCLWSTMFEWFVCNCKCQTCIFELNIIRMAENREETLANFQVIIYLPSFITKDNSAGSSKTILKRLCREYQQWLGNLLYLFVLSS